ncbi:4-(cytidine 5'-diphospho)-2-C-methyl-D-erythritol kinase [Candidatus Nitrotoga arctica]|uniref:4-diphosphocytidyl-2-C-methyl-D-erythritol kinase n=1 Tax=Candidatus Nitrotoga arctica TaxID=453162 RepID=A0ABM8Z1X6_9PROT|nr:4-(cytidine 5'-diphospho)-2-C-methyl-D-erythritol kinase [Candidatus Nitrotoga arctica]CAG9933910.1 4-(cytidine 5'-diphospho)-2-C-methyl-D-erythritol kinase [Candidatus Nitrotoga arctica]
MGNITKTLTLPAPAKLNLFLHVVGRRMDGYHLLQTLFRFIDFSDMLHFSLRKNGVVRRISALDGVPQEQDLCVRAARLLQKVCGCRLGVDITLEKRIPMGGGLGGGSSDAATTLLALNNLWNLGLSRERLMEIGLSLGADVPVFVFGKNAYAEGIGEQLQAYDVPDAWYVVLFPPVRVATAKVFAHLDFANLELTRDAISLRIRGLPLRLPHNDLQSVVCSLYPEVARHIVWLEQFAQARMSGSGACVFAEFVTEAQAQAVIEHLPSDMRGIVARGLAQHPLRDFTVM